MLDKNSVRDALTGKRIGNKEVISVDNAIDWVKKQGFIVIQPNRNILTMLAVLMSLVLLINLSSALITINPENTTSKYPNLIIKNNNNVIANLSLVYNTDNCLMDCYADINYTLSTPMALPNSFDFIDGKKNNKALSYEVYFYNSTKRSYKVPHYSLICLNQTGNKTYTDCSYVNDYYYLEYGEPIGFQRYEGQSLSNGTLRLVGHKSINDSIDWSFGYQGIGSDVIRNYWAWWNISEAYCRPFNIEGSTENINNIPIYKQFDSSVFTYINSSTGKNIQFVDAPCNQGGNELPYEVDYINSSQVGYWILGNVNTSNKTYSMYINTDNKAVNLERAGDVWKNDYVNVYHFSTMNSSNAVFDSIDTTYYANSSKTSVWNVTENNSTLGRSIYVYGKTTFITDRVLSQSLNSSNPKTFMFLSTHINPNDNHQQFLDLFGGVNGGTNTCINPTALNSNDNYYFSACSSEWNIAIQSSRLREFNVIAYNGTLMNWFVNKNKLGNGNPYSLNTKVGKLVIGGGYQGNLNGFIDELRIANKTFSSAYINYTYDNMVTYRVGQFTTDFVTSVTYPQFSNIISNNGSYDNATFFYINVTITDVINAGINFNGANHSLTNYSNNFTYTFNSANAGNYTYYFYGNSSSGGFNRTQNYTYWVTAGVRNPNTEGIFYLNLDTLTGVLILILMIVVSVVVLGFFNYELGCIFLLMTGIISIANESIWLGVMLIVTSVVAIFSQKG